MAKGERQADAGELRSNSTEPPPGCGETPSAGGEPRFNEASCLTTGPGCEISGASRLRTRPSCHSSGTNCDWIGADYFQAGADRIFSRANRLWSGRDEFQHDRDVIRRGELAQIRGELQIFGILSGFQAMPASQLAPANAK